MFTRLVHRLCTSSKRIYPPYRKSGDEISDSMISGVMRVPAFSTETAFVKRKSGDDISMVPIPSFVKRNRAMNGDHVLFDQKTNSVVSVLKRHNHQVLVKIEPGNRKAQPRDQRLPAVFLDRGLDESEISSLSQNPVEISRDRKFLAVANIGEWPESRLDGPDAEIFRVLGAEGDVRGAETDALLEFYQLDSSPHVTIGNLPEFPDVERLDLRDLPTFSIDPASAKDLDDAISVLLQENGDIEVWVHVADVSHYVRPGNFLDEAAKKRTSTVYLPGKIFPMLPRELSEISCSLLPRQDRRCFSVKFRLTADGELVSDSVDFRRTLIRSRERFSYEQVDEYLASGKNSVMTSLGVPEAAVVCMKSRQRRIKEEGMITFARPDPPIFRFDDSGYPVDVELAAEKISDQSAAHVIIEELMIYANRLVAEKLSDFHVSVYRTHQETANPEKLLIDRLVAIEREDVAAEISDQPLPKALEIIRTKIPGYLYDALASAVLADFKRAEYSAGSESETSESSGNNFQHWALGLSKYMHFTSPIRRYADIVAHRLLGRATNQDVSDQEISIQEVRDILALCNAKSKKIDDVVTDATNFYLNLLLKRKSGLQISGVVNKVINAEKPAVELYLPGLLLSRSVSLETLGLELVETGTHEMTVKGKDSVSRVIKLGMKLDVKLLAGKQHWSIQLAE